MDAYLKQVESDLVQDIKKQEPELLTNRQKEAYNLMISMYGDKMDKEKKKELKKLIISNPNIW